MTNYIMVVNKSAWPIHSALSWGGIQQQCSNNLARGASHDYVVNLGWHDLTVVVGTPDNKFDPNKNNNIGDIAMFIANIAMLALSPVGAVRLFASQVSGDNFVLSMATTVKDGSKVAKISGKQIRLSPVRESELYAPYGYTVTISGGDVLGTFDHDTATFTVTDVKPLRLRWSNRSNGNSGEVVGRVS